MEIVYIDEIKKVKVYKCSFCTLMDKTKSYVEKHEKICTKSPASKRYEMELK